VSDGSHEYLCLYRPDTVDGGFISTASITTRFNFIAESFLLLSIAVATAASIILLILNPVKQEE